MEDDTTHTQSEQKHQPEPLPAGSDESTPGTERLSANLKLLEVVNITLTAILVLTTIYYARLAAKSLQVSADMASLMKQANQVNFRPYVQIEGAQAWRTEQLGARSDRDANLRKTATAGASYVLLTTDGAESILYSARNLGQIPAHDVHSFVEVYVIDEADRIERLLPAQTGVTLSLTLFPNQVNDMQAELGKSMIVRSDQKTKSIKVKLRITYSGNRDVDPNTYFYSITLIYKPQATLEALSQVRSVAIEESDEGIVRAPASGQ